MDYIQVKNWENFQHYKDRTPPWIKLYNHLLDDFEFSCLPDASKAHLLSIWLLASRTENKIPNNSKWISNKINATEKVDIEILIEYGFIEKIPSKNKELHNMEQDASKVLHDEEQDACPEREERERREKEERELFVSDSFNKFWDIYAKKTGKAKCEAKFRKLKVEQIKKILDVVGGYVKSTPEVKFRKDPLSWLNGEHWDDEISVTNNNAESSQPDWMRGML